MNIIWKPNPLTSIVEVDDRDKERILLAYQEEHLCFILIRIENGVKESSGRLKLTLEQVGEEAKKWRNLANLDIDSPEITDLVEELKNIHMGDCTCIACSCMKCYTESYLGISTIEGLGSHEAVKIWEAFLEEGADYYSGKWHDDIDLALKNLTVPISEIPNKHYEGKEDLWKSCIPRWESERKNAYEWLKRYKEEHGF